LTGNRAVLPLNADVQNYSVNEIPHFFSS